ncbi:MAG: response regulator [Candidatus Thermoplasmatota archaeon]|mgnify:CR=1 FL=1
MRPALSVLVVEDDADLRDLVCQLLQGAGATAIGVANAEDAASVLASRQVDILLCDYILPGRNGVTFLRDVRAQHPTVRCLAMTGHPDPFILGRGHDDGYFVLTKPIDPSLLLALVDGGSNPPGAANLPIHVSTHS